jgi:hypothetical protein
MAKAMARVTLLIVFIGCSPVEEGGWTHLYDSRCGMNRKKTSVRSISADLFGGLFEVS